MAKPLSTLDIGEDFSRHSEQSEESISKSILNLKDSSVTSFPQNDGCNLRHCEVTKTLSTLDVCKDFSRHSEQSEESISKSILNLKDSSVTSFPQNDGCNLRHSEVTKSLSRLDICEDFSRHSEGECPTESSLSLTSKAGLLRLTPRNDIKASKRFKNCFNSGNKYHIYYGVSMKPKKHKSLDCFELILDYSGCRRSNVHLQLASFGFPPHSTENPPRNDEKKVAFTLTEVLSPLTQISFFCRAKAEISPSPARGEGKKNILPHSTGSRKAAFTLAEVLITLGIIGVVAAMTMSVLSTNVQNITLKNQFKKEFNTYSNAVQKVVMDKGELPACWYENDALPPNPTADWSSCNGFYTDLAKELNFIKYCDKNAFSNGCIPQYDKYNAEDNNANCPGFKESIVKTSSRAWVLADGSILFTYYSGFAPVFAVDINGFKKPNKGGYDLFVFSLNKRLSSLYIGGSSLCGFNSEGGKTVSQMLDYIYK